jgi:site-specific DNA-methyltransferase (adenine-specific)
MLVLDPFMGTGSTALACQKLKVDYIGFEIDKTYAAMAKKKLLEQEKTLSPLR